MAETDEFARKRQQLEQLKTDLENKLDASRVEGQGQFVKAPRVVSALLLGVAPGVRPEPVQMCARDR